MNLLIWQDEKTEKNKLEELQTTGDLSSASYLVETTLGWDWACHHYCSQADEHDSHLECVYPNRSLYKFIEIVFVCFIFNLTEFRSISLTFIPPITV